jgi:copper oxidase (laccase) domain-containing protein
MTQPCRTRASFVIPIGIVATAHAGFSGLSANVLRARAAESEDELCRHDLGDY